MDQNETELAENRLEAIDSGSARAEYEAAKESWIASFERKADPPVRMLDDWTNYLAREQPSNAQNVADLPDCSRSDSGKKNVENQLIFDFRENQKCASRPTKLEGW